ncbi:hypothetical protein MMC15_004794 [Xylographa vitiligo]|nr:hypothetical protein [Xylographa vitiligo]
MCREITTSYFCCTSQSPEPRYDYCPDYWYRSCQRIKQDTERSPAPCADCKFKQECQEGGIDASTVLEKEKIELFNETQQDEALMLHLMQAEEIPADTSGPLLYRGTMPYLIQERQTYAPTSEILEYQAQDQQEAWGQYSYYDGGYLGQTQQRLASTRTRRQRQTMNTLVSTNKRTRPSRSYGGEIAKKQFKRRKAENRKENLEEWIILSQPKQKQGRNVYRTYACQELIAMQQSPQKLSMIARELAQDFALDSMLEQENLGTDVLQRRQIYREWRDKSRKALTPIPCEGCTPMIDNEQTPIARAITQPVPVEEESVSEEDIRQSAADGIQALDAEQTLYNEKIDNLSVVKEGIQTQPETFHMEQEDYEHLDLETMMDAIDAANLWVDVEQYALQKTDSMEDLDALLS